MMNTRFGFASARPVAALIGSLLLSSALVTGCLKPPEAGAAAAPSSSEEGSASVASSDVEGIAGYLQPTWGDSSGKDGKGGVKLTVSEEGRLPLVKSDFDKQRKGDARTEEKRDWQLFFGPEDQSLVYQFVWVTTDQDKFFSNTWAGGGVAFNDSWGAVDGSGARYLVLWAKSSQPGVDFSAKFHSVSKAKGKEDTGDVSLAEFAPGGRITGEWQRIVIPVSQFPGIEEVDLSGLQQVIFNIGSGFPENEKVSFYIDNVYLTDIDMVTPVSNLGYLVMSNGVQLEWDKDAAEKVKEFSIRVGGKEVAKTDANARSLLVPSAKLGRASKVQLGVATVGANEVSDVQKVTVQLDAPDALEATVKLGAAKHAISPQIFGINWGSKKTLEDIGATGHRWGGNRTTKYNWKDDVDSAGVDWFYLNEYSKAGIAEEEKTYYKFIKDSLATGTEVNFCIPISDWVAKPHPEPEQRYCSFPTSKYPDQQKTDGQGCGNGIKANGEKIWGNDPSYSMVKNSPELQKEFVQTVVKHFGAAAKGGVQYYCMDNEPGLWMHTHRDTMPKGISAERLADLNIEYANIVKSVDPTAKVIGFGAWGVKELAGSILDFTKDEPDYYKKDEDWTFREMKKLGAESQLVYLLKRFKAAEQKYGKRLIDVIDIHWYQELYGKTTTGETKRTLDDLAYDEKFSALQFEALREWYDPTFKVPGKLTSWTWDANREKLWEPYHPVIPAFKKIIETHYPGTKLAINEYDNGSPEHYHGALLRAAALGIFMQEDLFMAQNWHQTDHKEFTFWAQKLYGNYDGKGSRVGGKFVPASSEQADLLSYAALDQGTYRIILVNKNPKQAIATTIALPKAGAQYRTFTLAETLNLRLLERAGKAEGQKLNVMLPAYSAMLVEVK